jgi:hypothetical protein
VADRFSWPLSGEEGEWHRVKLSIERHTQVEHDLLADHFR